jgi:hypothetical protein
MPAEPAALRFASSGRNGPNPSHRCGVWIFSLGRVSGTQMLRWLAA